MNEDPGIKAAARALKTALPSLYGYSRSDLLKMARAAIAAYQSEHIPSIIPLTEEEAKKRAGVK